MRDFALNFCRFLSPQYRRPLIAQEVLGYNADIICLQEVDEKAFTTYFQPVMSNAGRIHSPNTSVHLLLCSQDCLAGDTVLM
jgi:mRNA deadenylase 3'-5' endonuclease subunit Ccr4